MNPNQKRIPLSLKGIQRNKPGSVADDGSCQEIIGMRPRDGAWRVVADKVEQRTIVAGQYYYFVHQISPTRKAWWVGSVGYGGYVNIGYYLVDEDDTAVASNLLVDTFSGPWSNKKFSALGNVVIVSDGTGEVNKAYLFEPDNDSYRLVDDLLPDLFTATITDASDGTGTSVKVYKRAVDNSIYRVDLDAAIALELADQRENGYWPNKLYLRYAYELFDGSIVKHSQPIRIDGGSFDTWDAVFDGVEGDPDDYEYHETYFNKKKANFQITESVSSTILDRYKGIISSLNIYACRPGTVQSDDSYETYGYSDVTIEHTDPELHDVNNFYLVKRIAWEDLDTSAVNIFDGFDFNDLETQEAMPVDNLSNHTLYAKKAFNYNQRLFWSKIKNTLFSGFNPEMSGMEPTVAGVNTIQVYFEVTIQTDQGEKVVVSDASDLENTLAGSATFDCFAYPDSRASKLRMVMKSGSNYARTTNYTALTPHKHFNFAYAEDLTLTAATVIGALPTENKTYWDYNRVQATEIMNPYYFPAANSYRVGKGTIVGLAANTLAISQGQFGQYPVFVFSSDGVWTLEIGTEDVLVQSIKPLARHVCNNEDSILNIDGGCTFSTGKGLFIISGDRIVEISKEAEGEYTSPISSLSDYTDMLSSSYMSDLVCDEKFLDYLDDAVLGYDYVENEILLSKYSADYTWAYNVDNGMWYKRAQTWYYFIDDFPKMYGGNQDNLKVHDLTEEVSSGTRNTHVLIETRPLIFDVFGLKKFLRALIEGSFSYYYVGRIYLHLYGSADGSVYRCLYEDEITAGVDRILMGRSVASCEYFILVIGIWNALPGSYLSRIVCDIEERFTGKMRKDM